MAFSAMLQEIIHRDLDDRSKKSSDNKVEYTVTTTDAREGATSAELHFKFSKPIAQKDAELRSKSILRHVANSLSTRQLGVVDAILAQYGLKGKVGKKRTVGTVKVRLGDFEEEGAAGTLHTVRGKLISQTNLRSLLEVVAKEYLIKDMKRASAPLKYRTGRFANSLTVRSANIQDTDAGAKPHISIFYSYMMNPYGTFDPLRSTRPAMYNNPTYGARNPQTHIGDALAKAARDIIHSRYKIDVRQALL